jgi:hypothetical protein
MGFHLRVLTSSGKMPRDRQTWSSLISHRSYVSRCLTTSPKSWWRGSSRKPRLSDQLLKRSCSAAWRANL